MNSGIKTSTASATGGGFIIGQALIILARYRWPDFTPEVEEASILAAAFAAVIGWITSAITRMLEKRTASPV